MATIKARRVYVGKGLTAAEAKRKAKAKSPADFRGFSYNKATGWAVLA